MEDLKQSKRAVKRYRAAGNRTMRLCVARALGVPAVHVCKHGARARSYVWLDPATQLALQSKGHRALKEQLELDVPGATCVEGFVTNVAEALGVESRCIHTVAYAAARLGVRPSPTSRVCRYFTVARKRAPKPPTARPSASSALSPKRPAIQEASSLRSEAGGGNGSNAPPGTAYVPHAAVRARSLLSAVRRGAAESAGDMTRAELQSAEDGRPGEASADARKSKRVPPGAGRGAVRFHLPRAAALAGDASGETTVAPEGADGTAIEAALLAGDASPASPSATLASAAAEDVSDGGPHAFAVDGSAAPHEGAAPPAAQHKWSLSPRPAEHSDVFQRLFFHAQVCYAGRA